MRYFGDEDYAKDVAIVPDLFKKGWELDSRPYYTGWISSKICNPHWIASTN